MKFFSVLSVIQADLAIREKETLLKITENMVHNGTLLNGTNQESHNK
jgi:hypothetical protein